jgi:hypothetical protein
MAWFFSSIFFRRGRYNLKNELYQLFAIFWSVTIFCCNAALKSRLQFPVISFISISSSATPKTSWMGNSIIPSKPIFVPDSIDIRYYSLNVRHFRVKIRLLLHQLSMSPVNYVYHTWTKFVWPTSSRRTSQAAGSTLHCCFFAVLVLVFVQKS